MSTDSDKQRPTHEIFVVAGDEDAKRWVRVGAAFANRDGKGFNLMLDALPARDGRLVMRVPSSKGEAAEGEDPKTKSSRSPRASTPARPAP